MTSGSMETTIVGGTKKKGNTISNGMLGTTMLSY
jgi:hypothetical protein